MPLFFIEMGQGLIARGDLRVRTSTLYSCTLIAGYNAGSQYGGAYHYPSDSLENLDVRADMAVWVAVLRPTAVTLVFARDSSGAGLMGTKAVDRLHLQQWVLQQCGIAATTRDAVAVGMELLPGGYNADSTANLAGNFDPNQAIRLDHRMSGRYLDYGGYTLVGTNRER